jgi:hypothetical protein
MAEPQPETPISNNIYIALDIVGQTQLAHVGGYRDKLRLGVAMGHGGENVRIGAMKHYVAERLQIGPKSPYIHYKYPVRSQLGEESVTKESIGKALHKRKFSPKGTVMPLHAPLRAMKYDELTRKVKGGRNFRGHTYIADRFGEDIDRGR